VQNAASNVPSGLPNSGITQGSMFVIFGVDLGPETFTVDGAFPLDTGLGGTSVQITVSGVTVDGILYYAGPTQVAVILPSSTPAGTGTLTVTNDTGTSAPFPITVVSHALGIFTVSQSGSGDAIAYLETGGIPTLLTPTNAANPGEIVSFWGTGLAPVDFDETAAAQQFDMTDVALEAFVGGTQANIVFKGRNACCSSVDAVYVQIPADVVGCATPVTFRSGNIVSNTTTIALAESGRTCTPANPAFSEEDDFRNWFLTGTLTSGTIGLNRSVSVTPAHSVGAIQIPGQTHRMDSLGATFYRITAPPGGAGLGGFFDIASHGACRVYSFRGQPFTFQVESLDAGTPLAVNGPAGNFALHREILDGNISYSLLLDQTGSTLTPGAYMVSGPGGPDVGSISASIDVPPPLVWTGQENILEVDRSNGVTVNWTGGDPTGYVQVAGYSIVATDISTGAGIGASFDCTASTTAGSFTVPAYILLALPPTGTQSIGGIEIPSFGTLSVNSFSVKVFHTDGLDYGAVTHSVVNDNGVIYQ
jgi:uncharacterized protein (TIGR03437 family)